MNEIYRRGMVTRTGEREIGAVSGRVGMYNNRLLTAVHE